MKGGSRDLSKSRHFMGAGRRRTTFSRFFAFARARCVRFPHDPRTGIRRGDRRSGRFDRLQPRARVDCVQERRLLPTRRAVRERKTLRGAVSRVGPRRASANPEYVGVSVIGSKIHLSRPKNWVIRAASNRAEQRYIEYVSPNEYVFAIYERVDSPEDPWRDVMARYEEAVKADGAELLGARVPMSTWNAQGRAYVVRREVRAARAPFISVSREFLARSDHRIVLVQILHQTGTLEPVSDELLRVLETMVIN